MILKKMLWFQERFLSTAFYVDLYLGNYSYFINSFRYWHTDT